MSITPNLLAAAYILGIMALLALGRLSTDAKSVIARRPVISPGSWAR